MGSFDFGGAVSGGARAAGGLIDQSMREDAEIRAADRKLADAERLMAAQEMFKNRAAERFSQVMRTKAGEQIPVEAQAVTQTTAAGAKAAGLKDGLVGMTRDQVEAYKDPAMLAQYDRQLAADQNIAKEGAAGQTRNRTAREAARAAMEETLMKDPAAYMAGKGMLAGDEKADLEERKLASKEKIEQARLEQRDRSDDKKFEVMMQRIEAIGGGKSGGPTALMQNAQYMADVLGYSPDKIEKFIFEKKEISVQDIATKLMSADTMLSPEEAAQKASALSQSLQKAGTPNAGMPTNTANRPPLSSFKK